MAKANSKVPKEFEEKLKQVLDSAASDRSHANLFFDELNARADLARRFHRWYLQIRHGRKGGMKKLDDVDLLAMIPAYAQLPIHLAPLLGVDIPPDWRRDVRGGFVVGNRFCRAYLAATMEIRSGKTFTNRLADAKKLWRETVARKELDKIRAACAKADEWISATVERLGNFDDTPENWEGIVPYPN
jgi:hypothetical protein